MHRNPLVTRGQGKPNQFLLAGVVQFVDVALARTGAAIGLSRVANADAVVIGLVTAEEVGGLPSIGRGVEVIGVGGDQAVKSPGGGTVAANLVVELHECIGPRRQGGQQHQAENASS